MLAQREREHSNILFLRKGNEKTLIFNACAKGTRRGKCISNIIRKAWITLIEHALGAFMLSGRKMTASRMDACSSVRSRPKSAPGQEIVRVPLLCRLRTR